MPDYPTIPQYPEQGIQAELDLVYLWNPTVANELLAELNSMIAEVREMIDEIDLTPYRTAADQDIIDQDLQEQINTKQDIIEDLETIRSGAAAGATAVQPGDLATVATTGEYVDLLNTPTLGTAAAADVSDFATAAQGLLADTAVQPADIADMETQTHASNTYATQTTVSGIAEDVEDIQELIPTQATSSNQLADKAFVNSSIATNTAYFIGTFRSVSALRAYSGTVTNNDYAFVTNDVVTDNGNDWASFTDLNAYDKTLLTMFDYAWVVNGTKFDLYRFEAISQTWVQRATAIDKSSVTLNPVFNRYKATVASGSTTWEYEYTLNNSSFTASQWASINSGSTAESVALANSSLQPGDNVSDLVNDAGYLTAHQSLTDLGITATASELNVLDGITASTTELNYVDGVTSSIQTQLDGKQATLVNQSNIKSINGNSLLGSGDLQVNSYLVYPQSWSTGGTTKAFCDDINADVSAVEGMAYIGEVTLTDMPGSLGNAECVVEIMMSNPSTKTITLTLTSGNVSPYMWKYTYWSNGTYVSGWIGYQPELVSGTNIKTINNNSLLGSGDITIDSLPAQSGQNGKFLTTNGSAASWANVDALPAQTGHSGEFLTTNGSAASWVSLYSLKYLQNGSTGTGGLCIEGNGGSYNYTVYIGYNTSAKTGSVVIGANANAGGQYAVALGYHAWGQGDYSIQIGYGENWTANTMSVGLSNNNNYRLLDSDGTIPTDRFTTTPVADGTYVPTLTISSGTATRSWGAPASGLPSQSGHSGEFLTTDGTDASWATVNALQNNSTGSNSVSIIGVANSVANSVAVGQGTIITNSGGIAIGQGANSRHNSAIAIGQNSYSQGEESVGVGKSVSPDGYRGIAIGPYAQATQSNSIGIGAYVKAGATYAIQLGSLSAGWTQNSDANTFKVANSNGNYEIMSADGTIPEARLADTTSATAGQVLTLDNNLNATWTTPSGGGSVPTLTWYTVSSAGTTLTIADTSSAQLVKVYKNGLLLQPTEDYTISGTTLTTVAALVVGDKITTEVF